MVFTLSNLENLELVSLKENIQRGFENGLYKNQKKIKLTNKNNNKSEIYRSMAKASKSIKKSHGYIQYKIKKNIYENKEYKWEII